MDLLLFRQGWGVSQIMEPFNGHPTMVPALVFKAFQDVFGMESTRPMQLVATATFPLTNALPFVYVRRRIGPWGALIATLLILFLDAAFEDLLFAFQIGSFGSPAAGLGALIALDRDDREGDAAASILLVVSLTFSSVGIAFVAAAVAEWALNPPVTVAGGSSWPEWRCSSTRSGASAAAPGECGESRPDLPALGAAKGA